MNSTSRLSRNSRLLEQMDLVFQVLGEGKHDHQLKLLEYKGQMSSDKFTGGQHPRDQKF